MNIESAGIFMRCHRPGANDGDDDPRIQKAVRAAERDDALKSKLAEQRDLDQHCIHSIEQIDAPASLAEKIAALPEPEGGLRRFHWKTLLNQPPFLAVTIALLILLGWGIYVAITGLDDFPGKPDIERIIATNDETSGVDFDIKSAEVGTLEDWVFSRYGFDSFYVPQQLAGYKTVGCRVFKQDSSPVAEFAIDKNNMLFYMFRAKDFGLQLPSDGQWRVFKQDDWVAAVQQHQDDSFMVAFRGSKQQMRQFLQSGNLQ